MRREAIKGKLPRKPMRGPQLMPTRREPDRRKEGQRTACRGRISGHDAFIGPV